MTSAPRRGILGTFGPIALFRRLSCVPDARPYNHALKPGMRPETESCDRPDYSGFPEDPMRLAHDPGRLIQGPFPTCSARLRRLSYIHCAPMRNRPIALNMSPETESAGRRHFSEFPECPLRLTSGPRRMTTGPIAPIAPRFRRIPCMPDAPAYNIAHPPRMCPETDSGDCPDISRFPEDHMRSPGDPNC